MSPMSCHRRPKGLHNTGILGNEVRVQYPFHPDVGRELVVLADQIHDGRRHFTVRRECGRSQLLPAWMTEPEAASIKIVADPLLPIARLLELRVFLDVLVPLPPRGSRLPQKEVLMSRTMMKRQQPDLFTTTQADRLPQAIQVEAAKLLLVLLKEAVAKPHVLSAQSGQEVRHDEDHR